MTVLSGAVLFAALFGLARIDWRTHRLPNLVTIPLILAGLAWSFGTALDWYDHLLGAALGYGAFWLVEVVYRRVRGRDGLGRGDAKLLAAGGAWCGAWVLPVIVLIASVSALAYILPKGENREGRIAFGPFLAIGIGAVWLGQQLF
ncbi:MAG: A24 family peptidase [Litorimonas sp.]